MRSIQIGRQTDTDAHQQDKENEKEKGIKKGKRKKEPDTLMEKQNEGDLDRQTDSQTEKRGKKIEKTRYSICVRS